MLINKEGKLFGSEELRQKMPYGTLTLMAKIFNSPDSFIGVVIRGKKFTKNTLILDCAKELVEAYEECGFEKKKNQILDKYEVLLKNNNKKK